MKNKGFLMLESLVALVIAICGVMIFSMIVIDGRQTEQRIEQKTDQSLAKRMMKTNKISKVKVHDRIYTYVE